MSKRNNFTGVNNRVNARGVAFIKSRKSIDNVKTILNDMNNMADANGITLTRAYHDPSFSLDFDRRELDDFFEMIDSECAQVVVVRSLNEITDNVHFDTCCKGSCGLLHSNRPGSSNYFTR